ncbi:DeoR/GlpR family DNA-binding transcription regulator [Phycisphaerales bacterium AB-hyl4]|uniref:DeoR/GlpR family DNA-binding transcription regulator n=1 Tax=Natronomicrosphaera hydrolytica TaxID=3242702 RepID=A0ABV4U698_9BACT
MNEHVATTLSPDLRRSRILEKLEVAGEQTVEQLAEAFAVSGMTIRRDLQDLANDGRVLRTHGGAAPAARISFEFRFLERAQQQTQAKEAIADVAVGLIQPGQSVLLDSSTTTLAIARRLKTLGQFTVITTSLPIASELFAAEHITTILLGGQLRHDSPDMVGSITLQNLETLRADIAFIGADAIDDAGYVYNVSPDVGGMLARMATAAATAYSVADHTKVGRQELMRFAHLRDWAGLITDNNLNTQQRDNLTNAGVRVLQPPTHQP